MNRVNPVRDRLPYGNRRTFGWVSNGVKLFALLFLIFAISAISILAFTMSPAKPVPEVDLKEAMFYRKLSDNSVQCYLCFKKCIIAEGGRSFCRVRENREGKLYSLVYGKVYSWQVAPIEKDGMYHLLPGTRLLALATASCNFRCKQCHNWTLTQVGPEDISYRKWSPEEIIETAIRKGAKTISGTINEPTIFYEYLLSIFRLAREKGLKTQFHTNGGISPEPLRKLLKYTDGVVVDLKGFTERFYRETLSAELEPVLKTLKIIREEGVWLEITNLVIPTLNDDMRDIRRMCQWIKENLGEDVPLHFTRFSPSYRLTHLPPTPIKTLEAAHKIAVETELNYVTIGNVPGHRFNSTFCPGCEKRLIHRAHFTVLSNHIEDGKCQFCGHQIPGVWQ
jgi:pyruvate formate lyase activating enzyme